MRIVSGWRVSRKLFDYRIHSVEQKLDQIYNTLPASELNAYDEYVLVTICYQTVVQELIRG